MKNQLRKLGFSAAISQVETYANQNNKDFKAYMFLWKNNDRLMYTLDIRKKNNDWKFNGYGLVKTTIDIPKLTIDRIDTKELERRFVRAEKIYNDYYSGIQRKNDSSFLQRLEADLMKVFNAGKVGKDLASLLMVKYWPESEYSKYVVDGNQLRAKYETSLTVSAGNGELPTAKESYKRINQKGKVKNEHPIADEVLDLVTIALSKGEKYMAYNNSLYFIDKDDIHFFKTKEEAEEFAESNLSDRDRFSVLHFNSIKDVLSQIPYGEQLNQQLNLDPDANGLYNKDGNDFTDALIDHLESQQLSLFDKQLKTNVMNNDNLQYLKDNIK
ncbi:MAG TPA: hypothetical protein PKC62_11605, partial [Ferruginibacter sp.]|nr:hypothetical protein [Ferruginibacter sp.]